MKVIIISCVLIIFAAAFFYFFRSWKRKQAQPKLKNEWPLSSTDILKWVESLSGDEFIIQDEEQYRVRNFRINELPYLPKINHTVVFIVRRRNESDSFPWNSAKILIDQMSDNANEGLVIQLQYPIGEINQRFAPPVSSKNSFRSELSEAALKVIADYEDRAVKISNKVWELSQTTKDISGFFASLVADMQFIAALADLQALISKPEVDVSVEALITELFCYLEQNSAGN